MDDDDARAWRRRALAMRALANACAARIGDRARGERSTRAHRGAEASRPVRVTRAEDERTEDARAAHVARLMRALESRRSEERAALEGEIARLATRVRELEATARTPRRTSPRKEVLAPTSPDDWGVSCELSPSSTSEVTPERVGREEAGERGTASGTVGRDARPPRPRDGRGVREDDGWVEARARAAFARKGLPTHVRPGRGFVCPFTGDVVETPRNAEPAA